MKLLAPWFSLVKFSHSVFALPFALTSAWLAADGMPEPRVFLLIVLCAVSARTAAMGFNRLVDRDVDRLNPRTAGRELPSGVLRPQAVGVLVAISSVLFVALAFVLNPLCGWLSFPVLFVLLFYSSVKRFHWSAHLVLGLALGLAPLGAWLAVRGDFRGDLLVPISLALAVLTWVAGFDLIYACQDVDFDRQSRLHSIPERFGVARALVASIGMHVATVALLAFVGVRAELGLVFWIAFLAAAVLLAWQHTLVSADDLSRVDMAFFTLNGWVAVGLFVGTAVDLAAGVG